MTFEITPMETPAPPAPAHLINVPVPGRENGPRPSSREIGRPTSRPSNW